MSAVGLDPLSVLLLISLATIAAAGCGAQVELGGDTIRRIERESASSARVERVTTGSDRDPTEAARPGFDRSADRNDARGHVDVVRRH